jgi:DNA-binding LytR/AlgR family response regulator
MTVIIIEDEMLTAEDLSDILLKLPHDFEIQKILTSVQAAVEYFREHQPPDLIFCDIELGDGHSFSIFNQVHIATPVIFCTAFDQYALEAFSNNGVGYLLKPFTKKSIKDAIDRFLVMRKNISLSPIELPGLLQEIMQYPQENTKQSALLVNWKERIIPVKFTDIALFGSSYRSSFLVRTDNTKYALSHNLEELEQICGDMFFRATRQFLINKNAIHEVQQYSSRKLFVKLNVKEEFDITISKAKVPEFLSWLRR